MSSGFSTFLRKKKIRIEPIFYASCTNTGILHVHLVMIVVNRQLCPVTQLQFFQNAAEIIPNCSLAETECRSDFLVAVSLCNLCNDFLFFLIDDDQLVTLSLKTILESTGSVQVLATGTSGAEAIALYQQWKPDVLLLDIQMPNGSGLDAGEQILQQDPNARILFLTTFSDDAYIAKALELGAKGYLLKQDFAGIVPALEAVMQGQHVFGEQVVSLLLYPFATCAMISCSFSVMSYLA